MSYTDNKHNLEKGQIVKHKSDGTRMVVKRLYKQPAPNQDKNKKTLKCSWMHNGKYKEDKFYHYELEQVKVNNN